MFESPELQPRLACEVVSQGEEIVLARDGMEFAIEPDGSSAEELRTFLTYLDGTRKLGDIHRGLDATQRRRLKTFLEDLDRLRLLDDAGRVKARSGTQALLELEDLAGELMEGSINRNIYWTTVLGEPGKCPHNLFYGLAIENYHFLFRESLFDSPVLPFMPSTKARHLMNEFYCSEYGHDELVMRALNAIGISRDDMNDSLPLPETLALCNALSYWAAWDPLFFFATLGILEGKDPEVDLFIEACVKNGLPPGFIGPMKQHSDINRKAEHGNLTRLIFAEIPFIDDETMARMRRQMRLFVQMYDDFYSSIYNFYTTTTDLVRRMSTL